MEDWKKTYRNMLEDKNISYQQVREFVFPNIPKRLYRYREFDEYYMNNVSGEVYLSYPCKFNDPFDSAIEIDYLKYTKLFFQRELPNEFPIGKVEDIFKNNDVIKKEFDKHYQDTYKQFQEYVSIACFTTSFNNRLMWSHYADNHSGFCIEYDMTQDSSIKNAILPVIYDEQRFDCTEVLLDHSPNIAINPVFYKDKVWEYEEEWRTYGTKDYFQVYKNPIDARKIISAIYLGAKSEEHSHEVEEVKKYALDKKIPVYKMEMSQRRYELNPRRVC